MKPWKVRAPLVLVLASTLTVPIVYAGDATSPEIVDPAGDGGQLARDLLKGWIGQQVDDDGKQFLTFGIELASIPAYPNPNTAFAFHERISLWFKPTTGLPAGTNTAYISLVPSGTTSFTVSTTVRLGFSATAGTFETLQDEDSFATSATLAGTVISARIPLTALPGFTFGVDSLTNLFMNWVAVTKGPLNLAGAPDANLVITTFDRAPNSGFGRNYVSVGDGPAFNVSLPVAQVEVPSGGNASATIVLENLGADPINVTLSMADAVDGYEVAFEALHVTVPGGANVTANMTIATSLGAGNSTNLTVLAEVDGVALNVTLAVVVGEPLPPPTPETSEPILPGGSNETATPAEETGGGGVPGFGAAFLFAAGAAVAWRARRPRA